MARNRAARRERIHQQLDTLGRREATDEPKRERPIDRHRAREASPGTGASYPL